MFEQLQKSRIVLLERFTDAFEMAESGVRVPSGSLECK